MYFSVRTLIQQCPTLLLKKKRLGVVSTRPLSTSKKPTPINHISKCALSKQAHYMYVNTISCFVATLSRSHNLKRYINLQAILIKCYFERISCECKLQRIHSRQKISKLSLTTSNAKGKITILSNFTKLKFKKKIIYQHQLNTYVFLFSHIKKPVL